MDQNSGSFIDPEQEQLEKKLYLADHYNLACCKDIENEGEDKEEQKDKEKEDGEKNRSEQICREVFQDGIQMGYYIYEVLIERLVQIQRDQLAKELQNQYVVDYSSKLIQMNMKTNFNKYDDKLNNDREDEEPQKLTKDRMMSRTLGRKYNRHELSIVNDSIVSGIANHNNNSNMNSSYRKTHRKNKSGFEEQKLVYGDQVQQYQLQQVDDQIEEIDINIETLRAAKARYIQTQLQKQKKMEKRIKELQILQQNQLKNANNKEITYDYQGNSIIRKDVHPQSIDKLIDHVGHNVQNKNIAQKLQEKVEENNRQALMNQVSIQSVNDGKEKNKDVKKKKTQMTTDTCQSFSQNMRSAKDAFQGIGIIEQIQPSKGVTIQQQNRTKQGSSSQSINYNGDNLNQSGIRMSFNDYRQLNKFHMVNTAETNRTNNDILDDLSQNIQTQQVLETSYNVGNTSNQVISNNLNINNNQFRTQNTNSSNMNKNSSHMNNSMTLKLEPLQSKPNIVQQSKDNKSNNYSLNVGSVNDSISILKPKHAMELYDEDLLNALNINQSQDIIFNKKVGQQYRSSIKQYMNHEEYRKYNQKQLKFKRQKTLQLSQLDDDDESQQILLKQQCQTEKAIKERESFNQQIMKDQNWGYTDDMYTYRYSPSQNVKLPQIQNKDSYRFLGLSNRTKLPRDRAPISTYERSSQRNLNYHQYRK